MSNTISDPSAWRFKNSPDPANPLIKDEEIRPVLDGLSLSAHLGPDPLLAAKSGRSPLTVGFVDDHRFSQESIVDAFSAPQYGLKLIPFHSVAQLIEARPEVDLIAFHAHQETTFEARVTQSMADLSEAFPKISIVVLSGAEDVRDIGTFRAALKVGMHGLIPTRTTSMVLTAAAMHFVKAGGMFASKELLLSGKAEAPEAPPSGNVAQERFTSRQVAVLYQMVRGRANKIIAHELRMSESTVKVHVRNIMRKVGATNRTEAVYYSQQILAKGGPVGNPKGFDTASRHDRG